MNLFLLNCRISAISLIIILLKGGFLYSATLQGILQPLPQYTRRWAAPAYAPQFCHSYLQLSKPVILTHSSARSHYLLMPISPLKQHLQWCYKAASRLHSTLVFMQSITLRFRREPVIAVEQ